MPLLDVERYLAPSNRPSEIALGLFVGSLGLLFVGLASYVVGWGVLHGLLKGPFDKGWLGFVLVPAIMYILGVPGLWVAFRLLTGRARRDGGLLSPGVLRLGGVLTILVPVVLVIAAPTHAWAWVHLLSFTSAGIACFILAARRDRGNALDDRVSSPSSRPID